MVLHKIYMDKITTHDMSDAELQDIKDKKKCYDGPITGNLKCIIITALFALFYWFAPKKNKYILVLFEEKWGSLYLVLKDVLILEKHFDTFKMQY